MEGNTRGYSGLSALLATVSFVFFWMVMVELPRSDGIEGHYVNILLDLVEVNSFREPEMFAMPLLAITEARIISLLLSVAMFSAAGSVWAGISARRRKERSKGYAGTVALIVVLLLVLLRYSWVLAW